MDSFVLSKFKRLIFRFFDKLGENIRGLDIIKEKIIRIFYGIEWFSPMDVDFGWIEIELNLTS